MRKCLSILLSVFLLFASTSGFAAAAQHVTVNVVGAHGEPLADAAVQVLTPGSERFRIEQTNAAGVASIDLPDGFSFWIRTWANGHAVNERPYVPATDGPVITVTAVPYRAELVGLVSDEKGRPVKEARVSAWLANLGLQASVTTDANGHYRFDALQARDGYVLQVEARGYQPFVQADVALTPGARNQVDAGLTPSSGPVTGEVVNSRTGSPATNIQAELILNGWGVVDRTTTDVFGYFHFAAPPWTQDGYQVRLSAVGYETYTSAAFALNPGTWVNFGGASRIALNPLFAELSGSVLSGYGTPLTQTTVELQRDGLGTIETGRTDDNGFYLFEKLPAGTYRVRALPTGSYEQAASGWVTLAGGDRAAADLTADTAETTSYGGSAIVGTVRDHLGDPVKGASVAAVRGDRKTETTTDAQGRYRLSAEANVEDAADPETSSGYHVMVSKSGFIPTDLQQTADGTPPPAMIDVRARATTRADFTLQPATAEIAGQVLSDRGLPLYGVTVALVPEGEGTVLKVTTNGLGRYAFPGLAVARQTRYLPVVMDDRYFQGSMTPGGALVDPFTLAPGATQTHSLTVRPKTVDLRGEVKAGPDLAAAGATVTLVSPADGKTWTAPVSAGGTYTLAVPAVPGRQYLIRTVREGSTDGTAGAAVDPGADYGAVVNLAVAAPAEISGRVYTPDGRPAPGASLTLWAEGDRIAVAQAIADEQGNYRFANLAPGRRYSVAVWWAMNTWSTLAPGEQIISPLLSPGPGSTIRADLQAPDAGTSGQ
ncbi:MAG TPA: carboxypeptidase-like regulatory domain-containing protein [Symbiobacteriaceae bacterium]|nr:carboxypeptidase-like regulatory domain-containing protein [Symbiobacteriaceae bacterium]